MKPCHHNLGRLPPVKSQESFYHNQKTSTSLVLLLQPSCKSFPQLKFLTPNFFDEHTGDYELISRVIQKKKSSYNHSRSPNILVPDLPTSSSVTSKNWWSRANRRSTSPRWHDGLLLTIVYADKNTVTSCTSPGGGPARLSPGTLFNTTITEPMPTSVTTTTDWLSPELIF